MPYAPGVQNVSGQLLAQGVQQAAQSIAGGLQDYYKRQEEKKQEEQGIAAMQKFASENPELAQTVGLRDPNDKAAYKAILKSFGGVPQTMQAMSSLHQYSRQMKNDKATVALFDTFQKTGDLRAGLQAYGKAGGTPDGLQAVDSMLSRMSAPPKPEKALDPVGIRSVGPNGEPVEVTFDRISGRQLAEGPVGQNKYVLTPKEQIEVAGATESVKQDAQKASDFVTSVADAAEGAQATLPQIKTIRELYSAGAKSGFGQEFVTAAGSLATRLGIGDPAQQANREELQKLLANTALQTSQQLMKGAGAVSNYERELVNKASAEVGKTPAANLRIIKLTEALAERSIAAELERQKLVDEGKSTTSVAESLRRWRTSNPLEKFIERNDKAETLKAAPNGVDQKVWDHMTDEEKSLWQK